MESKDKHVTGFQEPETTLECSGEDPPILSHSVFQLFLFCIPHG